MELAFLSNSLCTICWFILRQMVELAHFADHYFVCHILDQFYVCFVTNVGNVF